MVRKSQSTRCSILKASGLLLMTVAWLFLNTMSSVMAGSHTINSATMLTMDQSGASDHVDHVNHAVQATPRKPAQTADHPSNPDEPMDDCVSISCCLITRDKPMFLQSWQYLSSQSFDKTRQAVLVEFKPGSQDRPPRHL
ncbi:MAG: hypothetical protein IBX58_04925 [Roseovarius sp.]|nr:hypothetical protein [Roseovarius sp.]